MSLISSQQDFSLLAALFAVAVFALWAEKQAWGKLLTGAVWAILMGVVLSNLNIIPHKAPVYSVVFSYIVPMLLPLFLMQANIKRILSESGRVGLAFILACAGTVTGVVVASLLFDLGNNESVLAGMFTATYTGGSANFAAVMQSTGFNDLNLISAATAVDNLLGVSFLMLITLLPASHYVMQHFYERDHAYKTDDVAPEKQTITAYSLAAALTYTFAVVALADGVVYLLNKAGTNFDFGLMRYLFITILSVIAASAFPQQMKKLAGGQEIGLMLALVFFATISAGADISTLLSNAPILLLFVLVILLSHGAMVFGGGFLLNTLLHRMGRDKLQLSLPELIIASNAAILGATTAPALAMARGWQSLITPGILVGVAGYIIGTPLGLLIASW